MRAAVLTVSDGVHAGVREDSSGDTLEELLREDGFDVVRRVVPDDADADRRRDRASLPTTGVARTDNGRHRIRSS